MKWAYYNEIDPYCAEWLRNLMREGLILEGEVDERSIKDVQPEDVRGFIRCHFFAGIAGWDYALQLAGWPEDRPVWTGSCPCQPFSVAGKRKGNADERHLWPEFYRLIVECMPDTVFGEQVDSKDGRQWLSGVQTDVEDVGFAFGAADLCAAGVRSPHRRQRLYWMAQSGFERTWRGLRRSTESTGKNRSGASDQYGGSSSAGRLVQSVIPRLEGHSRDGYDRNESGRIGTQSARSVAAASSVSGMAESVSSGRQPVTNGARSTSQGMEPNGQGEQLSQCDIQSDAWSDFDIVHCLDNKARRIESGTFPLAHGVPARVGKLRAYGNAICPQTGAEFIKAYLSI